MSHDINLEYKDVAPDFEEQTAITRLAEKLQFTAPSDAVMKLAIEKTADAIQASCRIVSHAGTFVAEAIADTPARAVQMVEKTIRRQLENWKSHRFEMSRFQSDRAV